MSGHFFGDDKLDSPFAFSFTEMVALVLAGTFGLGWHYLAKVVELRKSNRTVTLSTHYVEHKPETLASVMALLAGIWGLIEMNSATIFNVMLLGYTIDSHANKFRARGQGVL